LKVRVPAEWERQKSITVVFPTNQRDWQHSLIEIQKSYVTLINSIREFQTCVVIIHDKKILEQFFTTLENIEVYEIQTDDTWVRDFGAIDYFQDNRLKSYDFIFNAWGDKFGSSLDNSVNQKLQEQSFFRDELKSVNFVLEGGSIDSNGEGTLLTTAKCIYNKNRNPGLSHDEINEKIKTFFGLKQLIVLEHGGLEGDDTDSHVDTLARFIDANSIAYVKCYDKDDEHFNELDKMEKELQKTGFRLVPLPLPRTKLFEEERLPATYINFIFINNALIVPTYNDENDNIALEILKKEIKSRTVKSIDASIFIREYGSLHCASINQFTD
jgi:agmatine/peptidylarginine deiminase